ncbi:hypothetical protein ABT113_38760, partial [Streptomyces mirabilis]
PHRRSHHLLAQPDITGSNTHHGMKQREKTTSQNTDSMKRHGVVIRTEMPNWLREHREALAMNVPVDDVGIEGRDEDRGHVDPPVRPKLFGQCHYRVVHRLSVQRIR